MHGAEGSIGERASQSFRHVAGLVAMLSVEEGVEGGMAGLHLRLRRTAEESIPLSEADRVAEHVQLREWLGTSFGLPVLLNVVDCGTPGIDVSCCPVARVEERMV